MVYLCVFSFFRRGDGVTTRQARVRARRGGSDLRSGGEIAA